MKIIIKIFCPLMLALARALAQENVVANGTPYWWNVCLQDDVVVLRGVFDSNVSVAPDIRLVTEQSLVKKYLDPTLDKPSQSLDKAFYCVRFKPVEVIYISKKFKDMERIVLGESSQSGVATFVPAMKEKSGTYSQPLIVKNEAVRVFRIQPLVSDRDLVFKAAIQNTDLGEAGKLFKYLQGLSDAVAGAPEYVK